MRKPFQIQDINLYLLSCGVGSVVGKDEVNCEKSEENGKPIQQTFDMSLNKCSVKHKHLVKPLSVLQSLKRQKEIISHINNNTLFIRLGGVCVCQCLPARGPKVSLARVSTPKGQSVKEFRHSYPPPNSSDLLAAVAGI